MKADEEKPSGLRLKNVRYRLGLSIRDVVSASRRIAEKTGDARYHLSPSQIADMENHGRMPGIHKLCAISIIYDRPFLEILSVLGVDVYKDSGRDAESDERTRPIDMVSSRRTLEIPLRFDPMFSRRATTLLNRVIAEWGVLPFEFLSRLDFEKYLYVRIGREDNLMHPLLRPGAVVKVDTRLRAVEAGGWHNEYERPVHLVETPRGWRCAWCLQDGKTLILVPHPLSRKPQESYVLRKEAEVIGRVAGGWMPFTPDDGE